MKTLISRGGSTDFSAMMKGMMETLTFKGYQKYLDTYWRPDEMIMVNHQNGKSTRLVQSGYKFQEGLKDRDFSKSSLKRAR